jgi:hypothetical protein
MQEPETAKLMEQNEKLHRQSQMAMMAHKRAM